MKRNVGVLIALLVALPCPGWADDDPPAPAEVTISGARATDSAASHVSLGKRELELRPRLRPGDIVEAVPGLFAVQHAGGGKANQYFLRGFDADHGTDVAFFVDGVPVNMVSHGHGQGFSDLHFLIPELVVGLEGYKGPYPAHLGDFATAGAVELKLAEKFEESYAELAAGQYGVLRALAIASPELGEDWRAVIAGEAYQDDGPFLNSERLRRFNFFARATRDIAKTGQISMTWMSYGSGWRGSGQIPARAVCGAGEAQNPSPSAFGQPCIDHFGFVDPSEGGDTQRHQLSLAYTARTADAEISAMTYLVRYGFSLYSNFTFFAVDPVHGDEIEQDDDRTVVGADFRYRQRARYRGAVFTTTGGVQARNDTIDNALYHDELRERLEARGSAHIVESELGLYAEEDARLTPWLRFVAGLRGQHIDVNVDDKLEDLTTLGSKTSGIKSSSLVLPKMMAIVSPLPELDLFADFGRGFHSNDARGVVRSNAPATLVAPATGYELGIGARPLPELSLHVAAFLIDLDSELVWSGDEGTTEPSGATRRYGLELGGRYHLNNWLFADADVTSVRARFRDSAGHGQAVALAPGRTFSAGIGARRKMGEMTPFGALRVKSIAARPAAEDESLTAEGFTVVDANRGGRWRNVELGADVQNVFDTTWREVQFANTSRLSYEPVAVTGIHYSSGWPRTIIARMAVYFH